MKILCKKKIGFSLAKRLCKEAKSKTHNYFENTTLHGFNYIVKKDSSLYKSTFWSVICISCVMLCSLFMYMQLVRYQNNRVTTTVTTTNYPIWNIPFPAVTICNFNVVYREHTEDFFKILSKYGIADRDINDYFLNLSSIILNDYLLLDEVNWDAYGKITNYLSIEGYDTERLMEKLAQPCLSMIQRCQWKSEVVDCEQIFRMIKTTAGFCCSFNYKGVDTNNVNTSLSELYVQGAGPNYGLEIYLDAEVSQYMSSTKPNYGHIVIVHDSHEYPDIWLYSASVNLASKISYGIKPVSISSNTEIKTIDIKTRRCIFSDEKKLPWTNYYTFNACLIECKARVIRRLCGCLPFFFPLATRRFCSIMDLLCLQEADKLFSDRAINTGENYQMRKNIVCNCRTQCNEINYDHSVEHEQLIPTTGFDLDLPNSSIVSIYFSNIGVTQFTRTEYLTWDSLLASIGGIFGLFLGGSIVSVIEIVYHVVAWTLDTKKTRKQVRKKINKVEKYDPKLYWSELYPKPYQNGPKKK